MFYHVFLSLSLDFLALYLPLYLSIYFIVSPPTHCSLSVFIYYYPSVSLQMLAGLTLPPSLPPSLSLSPSISSSYSSNTVSSLAEQHVGSHGNRVYSSSPFDFPCCSTPSCAKWTHYSKQSNNVDIKTKTSTNKQILKG